MTHCLVNHHITGHLVFVFISTEFVMLCHATDNRAVISFLHASNVSAVEMHRELCVVYAQNVMSEGTARLWCRAFEGGRANKCSRWRACGQAAICSEWVMILFKVLTKFYERQRFTISELSCEFPQISHTILYEIITVRLGYHHKFMQDRFRKRSRVSTKRREWFRLRLFRAIPKRWLWILNHIIGVTKDETWVSSVNVDTKYQSK
jgi:hypothetical protein